MPRSSTAAVPESAQPTADLNPLHIPSVTRVLDNGLRVVVHEDPAAPVVAVHLMIHTGSRHERRGRTGLAHLLEHLLFEGTEHCPKGGYDRLLEQVGASSNGSTWWDRTNYYETVPSNALELALWLERERLAHFLPVLDEEMLTLQRGVVANERRQVCDDRPYGLAEERLQALLFPAGHPYGHPTIGHAEDIARIELDDARAFYRSRYTPAETVLVLAGDVTEHTAFRLADRYLGDGWGAADGKGDGVLAETPLGSSVGELATETLPDRVSFPRLYRGWRVPPYGSRDWAALDVLSYLLTDGESSRLNRALVRDGRLAQDADAYLYPTELEGMFGITATARSGVPLDDVDDGIRNVLESVANGRLPEDEVRGAVRRARRDHLSGLATAEDRAEALAYAATVLGSADDFNTVLDHYRTLAPEDLAGAAHRWLPEGQGAAVRVVPRGRSEDGG